MEQLNSQHHAMIATLVICATLLFFKMLGISIYQGIVRFRYRSFHNEEDARTLGVEARECEHPAVVRAGQAWRNDLENIPIFLALSLIAVHVRASFEFYDFILFTFTVSRFLHTVFYLTHVQPWRTVAFFVGLASTICLAGYLLLSI